MKKMFFKQKKINWIIAFIIGMLFVTSLIMFWWQARNYKTTIIQQDLKQLAAIFYDINATAGIEGFEHNRNYIDFLNVKKFLGSTLGSINLRYPDRWRGPYVTKNPTIQTYYYQIIKAQQGYFITPGNGVSLPNGSTIGKDIDLSNDPDMTLLLTEEGKLTIHEIPMAVQIGTLNQPFIPDDQSLDPYHFLDQT